MGVTWGERLRDARLARSWSLEQMADALGVNRSTIWRWEVGVIDPPLSTVEDVNHKLGIEELS